MIGVIDYGIGNLRSAYKAFTYLGAKVSIIESPSEIRKKNLKALVLPGVGAFGATVRALKQQGFDEEITKTIEKGIYFLGICVGFQVLCRSSEESKEETGLSLIAADLQRLKAEKVPQMQWNKVEIRNSSLLSDGCHWFYYVHSYFLAPVDVKGPQFRVTGVSDYEGALVGLIESENVFGVQFHPEKSGQAGLLFLSNFIKLVNK